MWLSEKMKPVLSDDGKLRLKCPECDAHYQAKNVLVRHFKSEHVGVKFHCFVCGKLFKRNDSMKEHVRNIHKRCSLSHIAD